MNAADMRWATTNELRAINADAVKLGLNRSISDEGIASLDPDGRHLQTATHLLDEGMTHRTEWMIKTMGSDEPVMVFVDLTLAGELILNGLGRVSDLLDGVRD